MTIAYFLLTMKKEPTQTVLSAHTSKNCNHSNRWEGLESHTTKSQEKKKEKEIVTKSHDRQLPTHCTGISMETKS